MEMKKEQDPAPYMEMKHRGASPEDVYRQARKDGYESLSCYSLLMGVFDIGLNEAREVIHRVYHEGDDA